MGVSESWVEKAIAAGKIKAKRLGGQVRVDIRDLDEYINNLPAAVGETVGGETNQPPVGSTGDLNLVPRLREVAER
jgi:excisionase family DNA binding protein